MARPMPREPPGHERGLAGEVDHPSSSCGSWPPAGVRRGSGAMVSGRAGGPAPARPGRRRRAGPRAGGRSAGRTISARAGGIGSTESQSTGARTVTSSGRTAASPTQPARGVGGPLHGDRARREPGAERDQHDLVADVHAPLVDGLGQRDRHRRGRGVPVLVEVHEHPLHRQVEALGHRLDDPDVGLVRDEQVDVAAARSRPCRRPRGRSRRASGSRSGRSRGPPSGSCARRG